MPSTGCAAVSIAAWSTRWVRVLFKTASRLGDGVIWYALMLALPFSTATAVCDVALRHAGHGRRRTRWSTNYSSAPSCASVPSSAMPEFRWPARHWIATAFRPGHTLHAVAFTWQACAAFPELELSCSCRWH